MQSRATQAATALLIMRGMESGHPLDPLIAAADRALRALFAPAHASRPTPGASPPIDPRAVAGADDALTGHDPVGPGSASAASPDRRQSAALMRVNHAGEIAAQALYHGQALVSRSEATRELLLRAAREESDHLAWCETRLRELDSRPSLLNPLWYCGSFAIGALAAVLGDRMSLGFVVETERQVEGHLDEHLARLPAGDARSRAILEAMRTDEIAHGAAARSAGAAELPGPVRALMRQTARIMTSTAYWI
jgi:3-demethoxyubiquinol 3-hydroxylase